MKKKYKIIFVLILISLFACIPYFTDEIIEGNDTAYHLNRILGLSHELKNNDYLGFIHSNLQNGFGYANGLFYPQLFIYIPAILVSLGMDIIVSYKVFIVLITIATSFITYYSIKKITKDTSKTIFITFLYVLSTYRLGDIYVRSALGEILAFTFMPLILVGLYEILYGENKKWWLICIGIFGIVNSHVLSAIFVLALIILCCLFNIKKIITNKKILKNLFIAGIISILISISFIGTYIELIKSDLFNFEIYDNSKFLYGGASSLQDLLKGQLSDVGNEFSISLILLILPTLLLIGGSIDYKKDVFLIDCYKTGMIFLVLSTRLIPWKCLSIFSIIQFPFRFSIIYSLILSYIAGEAVFRFFKEDENRKLIIILIVFFIGTQLSTANVNMNDSTYDQMINNYPLGLEEYSPINLDTNVNFICDIDDEPEVEKNEYLLFSQYKDNEGNTVEREDISTIDYKKEGAKIEFYYDKDKKINLHIPLTYYKGYIAYLIDENNNRHDLELHKEEKNANIVISSDEIIKGTVIVKYQMTIIQRISYIITLLSSIILIVIIIRQKQKEKK